MLKTMPKTKSRSHSSPERYYQRYYLSRIEVFNWGNFQGFHEALIDEKGTAVIGQTGSGKTTLIDALMTLLTSRPRYNFASTGGHESDRSLMSYIRGVAGSGENLEQVARGGKTVTAVTAYFQPIRDSTDNAQQPTRLEKNDTNSSTQEIAIGVIYWIDSTSNSAGDRKDIWLVADGHGSGLKDWLNQFEEGGSRLLKTWVRGEDNLNFYDSKKRYLAKIKSRFKVSEQAFNLLNKAVGLKQLNSIDEVFRELVLDDVSLFGRAEEVISQFDDLSEIKATLETAKRQQKSLAPLQKLHETWQSQQTKQQTLHAMQTLLPSWFAYHGKALWSVELARLTTEKNDKASEQHQQQAERDRQNTTYESLFERYHQQGGGELQRLEIQIAQQTEHIAQTQQHFADYAKLCETLSLPVADNEADFTAQKQQIEQLNAEKEAEICQTQSQVYEIGSHKYQLEQTLSELGEQLTQANAQTSNIPPKFEQFRTELASHLGQLPEDLPFVAELLEVKADEQDWRGAIERALGSHRLRLLVPPTLEKPALDWVNARNNRLHVRLYKAKNANVKNASDRRDFFADSYLHKLNFKTHLLREPLKDLLVTLDRHCVANTHTLQRTAHAMTMQGLMSSKVGWYDKQDQKALNADWLTGFDNKDLVKQLTDEIVKVQAELNAVEKKYQSLTQTIRQLQQQQRLLESIQTLAFSRIDVATATNQLAQTQQRYDILNSPDSDLSRLKLDYQTAKTTLDEMDKDLKTLAVAIGILSDKITTANRHISQADAQLQTLFDNSAKEQSNDLPQPLTQSPTFLAISEKFTAPTHEQLGEISQLEKEALKTLSEDKHTLSQAIKKIETNLVRQMGQAQQQDTGALSEVGSELSDLADYLQRLRFLNEEDLPSKQQRFLKYLNESSQDSVSQMLDNISQEVSKISERIDELNVIMKAVDFEANKYLRLNAKSVVHSSLRALHDAQRKLKAVTLSTEDSEGEAHYKALQALIAQLQYAVDNKRTQSAKALLDPRYRLTFSVSVMARTNDQELENRTGSQGGSGGEKEIIASHILTASLSYALTPQGQDKPTFATIVLDEAFSKSSPKVATRIVEAIRAFGLHPLFVTPNKEMRLLRQHTQSAVLVMRKDNRGTLSNWSWQQIDEVSREKLGTVI